MLVMKFGGTSVEDAAAIRNVAAIVTCEIDRSPLVLVSACAGITNALLHAAAVGIVRPPAPSQSVRGSFTPDLTILYSSASIGITA